MGPYDPLPWPSQTRRRIVDATLQLHGAQDIAATSRDDIAAQAGVGVRTVYRHFARSAS